MAGLARTGAIALSLAVNAGLLTLLALEDRRPAPRRIWRQAPLYIEIEPVIIRAKAHKSVGGCAASGGPASGVSPFARLRACETGADRDADIGSSGRARL